MNLPLSASKGDHINSMTSPQNKQVCGGMDKRMKWDSNQLILATETEALNTISHYRSVLFIHPRVWHQTNNMHSAHWFV